MLLKFQTSLECQCILWINMKQRRESQGTGLSSCHESTCSVTQSCPTHCDPINCSTPGFPVLHHLSELAQTHVELVMISNYLCYLLLLLPSIFPRIEVFSNESALHNRGPKYWSFSSNESTKYNLKTTFLIYGWNGKLSREYLN